MNFQWIPHQEMNLDALERMKKHFKKPDNDPPEAWFMSPPQKYFPGLYEALTIEGDLFYIRKYLREIASGIEAFEFILKEWREWLLFLLPYLLERILKQDLLPLTINYFINVYFDSLVEEYAGFREDVLSTLPQAIMMPSLWSEQDVLRRDDEYYVEVHWAPLLNSSLFFCLKFLNPDEISSWVASIARIKGEFWQSEISKWLRGMNRLVYLIEHPQEVPDPDEDSVYADSDKDTLWYLMGLSGVDWDESHCVFRRHKLPLFAYIPEKNLVTFWEEVQKYPNLSFK